MKIEVWSDYACPFCYIGEKQLEQALEKIDSEETIELVFNSFQLDPNATRHEKDDINEKIAQKYGISYEDAKRQNDRIINMAKEVGLNYRYDIMIRNNTSMAHQATKQARVEGKEKLLANQLFKAYFEKGQDIGDIETILKISGEVGIDVVKMRKALEEKTYVEEVNKQQQLAAENGIQGVPYFVIDEQIEVSGVRTPQYLENIIREALEHK